MRTSCFTSSTGDSPQRAYLVPVYLLFFLSVRYLFVSIDFEQLSVGARPKNGHDEDHQSASQPSIQGHQNLTRNNVIYGHVHMAKTGGSSINGMLALQYERVCGNKGYSFNAYQANNKNTRGETNQKYMVDWGFEDCDYISVETGYSVWRNWGSFWIPMTEYFHSLNMTMELHVPCRDPLEHLMSMCNMKRRSFDCETSDLEHEFSLCSNHGWL